MRTSSGTIGPPIAPATPAITAESALTQTHAAQHTATQAAQIAQTATAAAATPTYLDIKSPIYRLSLSGELPTAAILTVPIPNDALPYETLDMYGWTGSGWMWMPSRVIAEEYASQIVQADVVVDATGDADIAAAAGARFVVHISKLLGDIRGLLL